MKYNVADLVGKNIKGLRVNRVDPHYREQYKNNPQQMIVTLLKAEWRIGAKNYPGRWLWLTWEHRDGDSGCNYSGWKDGENPWGPPTVEALDETPLCLLPDEKRKP